jgi:hypothetical protein
MKLERNLPPPLDSQPPLLILRNSENEQRVFETRAAPSTQFEEILSKIISLENLASESTLLYWGTVDAEYYPAEFEWVRPALEPRREIRWAPHATDEQIR